MSEAIKKLTNLNVYKTGNLLTQRTIILAQKYLKKHTNLFLPCEYLDFIKNYNGFCYMGGRIYGIFDKNTLENNIFYENINKRIDNCLVLGEDEFDYLCFNCITNKYQILDKQDLEVLEEYIDFDDGFFNIIKL